jgi:hypothetical protein
MNHSCIVRVTGEEANFRETRCLLFREGTIPTDLPMFGGEVSASFCV